MNSLKKESFVEIKADSLQSQYLKDLFAHRELLYFFAWRDILVRYKEAFFGIAWALFRPLLNMIIFSFVFGKIAKLDSSNINFSIFVLAGLLPWQLCSMSIVDGANSVLNNVNLISKIYFPRIIIPTAQLAVHILDFFVGLGLLFLFSLFVQPLNLATLWTLPFFILLALTLCEGGSLWLSALTVTYKDIRFLVPFIVQIGTFICPIGYSTNMVPDKWLPIFCLNPMVGIIDGFRWALFGVTAPNFEYSLTVSCVTSIVLLITGFRYFRKVERSFVDRI